MKVEGEVFSFDIFQAMKYLVGVRGSTRSRCFGRPGQEIQSESRSDPLEAILNGAEGS
ncbi:unnamed protein product [Rhodiola kirilowii]